MRRWKIQDVTHKMGGIGIIFNFGDVMIQTAGTKPEVNFKVPGRRKSPRFCSD